MSREPLLQPGPPRYAERRLIVRVQERLNQQGANLIFSGTLDIETQKAIGKFQYKSGLKRSRKLDAATLGALGLSKEFS